MVGMLALNPVLPHLRVKEDDKDQREPVAPGEEEGGEGLVGPRVRHIVERAGELRTRSWYDRVDLSYLFLFLVLVTPVVVVGGGE